MLSNCISPTHFVTQSQTEKYQTIQIYFTNHLEPSGFKYYFITVNYNKYTRHFQPLFVCVYNHSKHRYEDITVLFSERFIDQIMTTLLDKLDKKAI